MGFASLYTILRKLVRTCGDALDEERWGSRQRPSRRPNAVVAPGDERHGCRERRARPWMAHRAGPQSGDGVREPRRSRGRMMGQALLVSFGATAKRDSPGGAKPESSPELGNQLDSNPLATLNADRANSCAHRPAGATQRPGHAGAALRAAWRMNSPLRNATRAPENLPMCPEPIRPSRCPSALQLRRHNHLLCWPGRTSRTQP